MTDHEKRDIGPDDIAFIREALAALPHTMTLRLPTFGFVLPGQVREAFERVVERLKEMEDGPRGTRAGTGRLD
jgi:hypothetical protein